MHLMMEAAKEKAVGLPGLIKIDEIYEEATTIWITRDAYVDRRAGVVEAERERS